MFMVQSFIYQLMFLGSLTMTKYVNGIAVGSFNRLVVGDDQINNLANSSPAVNIMNGPAVVPRSRFRAETRNVITAKFKAGSPGSGAPKAVVPSAVPVPSRMSNSFQGNVGGPGSFKNNAGTSLVPDGFATAGIVGSSRMESDSYEDDSMMYDDEPEMKYAAHWALYRKQMLNWAAKLRAKLRLIYSMYPYAAYYYWDDFTKV